MLRRMHDFFLLILYYDYNQITKNILEIVQNYAHIHTPQRRVKSYFFNNIL